MGADGVSDNTREFSAADRARASGYHRPLYLAAGVGLLLTIAVYAALTRVPVAGVGWAGDAALEAVVLVAAASLVHLPLDLWSGFRRERRFGFRTSTLRGYLADRAKAVSVGVALAAAGWTGLVALPHALPRLWPLPAGTACAAAVVVVSLVAPVVLEPLFNRFEPLDDERLADELRALARRAGVPVREVLVADASRRTTKLNAYVSGLGPTRRVVLWDTLLARSSEPELKLVVAHELGHRRERHVLKGTALAAAGAALAIVLLWAALGTPRPHDLPLAALLLLGLRLAALPAASALSRRFERAADRFSLALTGDADTFVRTHVALARANLSDLAPPRLVYLLLFSHPTPPERIALARRPD